MNIPKDPKSSLQKGANPSYRPEGKTKFPIVYYIEDNAWEFAKQLRDNKGIFPSDGRTYDPSKEELDQILSALMAQEDANFSWVEWAIGHKNCNPTADTLGKLVLFAAKLKEYPFIEACLKKFSEIKIANVWDEKKEKSALHYLVEDGNVNMVKLLMEHGMSPGGGENSPIAFAFELCQEKIILAMLRHSTYKASILDFEKSACHYIEKRSYDPHYFEEILLNLAFNVDSREIGLMLSLHIAVKSRVHFQKSNPDMITFAEFYIKIFSSSYFDKSAESNSQVAVLEKFEFKPAVILLELRRQSIGKVLPKNLRPLLLEFLKNQVKSDVKFALKVSEVCVEGYYGDTPNFEEAASYFQKALTDKSNFSTCSQFLLNYQKVPEILKVFVDFTLYQVGEFRDECEFLMSRLDFDLHTLKCLNNSELISLLELKDPSKTYEERAQMLVKIFLDPIGPKLSLHLELSAYLIYKSWFEGPQSLKDSEFQKACKKMVFEKNEVVVRLSRGLSNESHSEDCKKILLDINTSFARAVLINYFSNQYGKVEQLPALNEITNPCEKLVIHKFMAIKVYRDSEIKPLKKLQDVQNNLLQAIEDPEAKEFYAELLRDGYFNFCVSSKNLNVSLDPEGYFYVASCQFLELYNYAIHEPWLLERADMNRKEALKLKHPNAEDAHKTPVNSVSLTEGGNVFMRTSSGTFPTFFREEDGKNKEHLAVIPWDACLKN